MRGYARLDAARFAALTTYRFRAAGGRRARWPSPSNPGAAARPIRASSSFRPTGIGGLGGNLFRPVRTIAHRDPAGGRAALSWRASKTPHWRAGGLMLQMTPEASKAGAARRRRLGAAVAAGAARSRIWSWSIPRSRPRRCCGGCSMKTRCGCSRPSRSTFRCDCDAGRIATVLKSYAPEERARPGRSRRHHPRPLRVLRHDA